MQHKVSPGHPGGAPVNDGRPQAALRKPCRAGSRHVWRPYGRGRMTSAPTGPAVAIPPCRRRVRDAAPYGFGGGPVAIIHQSFSAARHRRRPGGPGRYSVAMIRACGVIDAGRPRRGSACHETKKGTGRGCTPGSCFVCTAFRRHEPPYWGAPGALPRPFLSHRFLLERKRCPGRAGTRREAGPPPDGRILSAPTGLAVGVPRWSGPHLGRRRAGSYPTDGAPAAQASGNPSSAPVRALGHLPPSGGKAPGARCAPPGETPVSGQKSAPPGIRAALVFTALRGNTPNQGWQAAACRGCCAGR